MSAKVTGFDPALHAYLVETTLREATVLRELREETAQLSNSGMQIGPEQGQFMALLARAIGARQYLEIGTFTGYSALAIALALPPQGRVVACDVSREYTDVARRYWRRAKVDERIDLRLGPATATLDALIAAGESGCFDMAFIDADKANVDVYYERCLQLVRIGGLILIDNVLWDGRVVNADVQDEDTCALRAIARKVGGDERVDGVMIAVCDGLLMIRKR
ncbi:MAG: class I SAM-dependent methyltransferase [Vulcanimicrobiaceae bacterium]